jgi:hypothetical protein
VRGDLAGGQRFALGDVTISSTPLSRRRFFTICGWEVAGPIAQHVDLRRGLVPTI